MSTIKQNKPRVLVTAAAGRTGSITVLGLLEKGFPVRAFVRRSDVRSEVLRKAGAEIFVGDLFDMRALRRALVDVQRAYYCAPVADNLLHGSMLFAMAAEEAKLEVVALMSQWHPQPVNPSLTTREHWIANNVYRWMPTVDVVHINPGLFAFMYLLGLASIVHLGMLAGPWGEGLNAPPSHEDIGNVIAEVLADPTPHIGASYRPSGPELISPDELAGILTRVVGRTVKYRDVSPDMFLKAATAQGFPPFIVANAAYYFEELSRGTFAVGAPTDHFEQITGKRPESFESIATRYVAQPDLIQPGLRAGTKLEALKFDFRFGLIDVNDENLHAAVSVLVIDARQRTNLRLDDVIPSGHKKHDDDIAAGSLKIEQIAPGELDRSNLERGCYRALRGRND